MHIAQVAPPFESVPPARYGGTEQVVSTLTEELVRLGHDVTLFASGDSQTTARLVPVVDGALWHAEPPYRDLVAFSAATLGKLARELGRFDVVHNHLDYLAYPLARLAPCPVITTPFRSMTSRSTRGQAAIWHSWAEFRPRKAWIPPFVLPAGQGSRSASVRASPSA